MPPAGNVRHRRRTGAVAEMNAVDSSARAIRVGPELWRETIDANLPGVVHPERATPPGMIERPGEAGPLDPRYPTGAALRGTPAAPDSERRPGAPESGTDGDTDGLSDRAAFNGGLSGWTG